MEISGKKGDPLVVKVWILLGRLGGREITGSTRGRKKKKVGSQRFKVLVEKRKEKNMSMRRERGRNKGQTASLRYCNVHYVAQV